MLYRLPAAHACGAPLDSRSNHPSNPRCGCNDGRGLEAGAFFLSSSSHRRLPLCSDADTDKPKDCRDHTHSRPRANTRVSPPVHAAQRTRGARHNARCVRRLGPACTPGPPGRMPCILQIRGSAQLVDRARSSDRASRRCACPSSGGSRLWVRIGGAGRRRSVFQPAVPGGCCLRKRKTSLCHCRHTLQLLQRDGSWSIALQARRHVDSK